MYNLFPGLQNLKGGKKDQWIRNNLTLIATLNDHLGFNETATVLYMKPQTLSRALELAEGSHRPVITKAEKAMSRAALNENRIHDIIKELNAHAGVLESQANSVEKLRKHLGEFFEFQAAANKLMASVMSSMETIRIERNFTEHVSSTPQRKVGPSHRVGKDRLSVYHGPVRKRLTGPCRSSPHRNYKRRRQSGA